MSGLLADDDFLALDAEFAPMFARHYVITQNEAHNLAAILAAKPVGHFRLYVHVAVSMFVESIIALSPSALDRAVRHVAKVILKDDGKAAELFVVDNTDIEPATHAAVVAYRSHIPDAEPFATVAARKKIARQVVGRGAKMGAPVDTLFGGFCGTLDDIAREVTGTRQRLPSKMDIDIDSLSRSLRGLPELNVALMGHNRTTKSRRIPMQAQQNYRQGNFRGVR